jgi:hypothetical protein
MLTDDELAAAQPEKTRTIDIAEFVEVREIDPILFDHPYYELQHTVAIRVAVLAGLELRGQAIDELCGHLHHPLVGVPAQRRVVEVAGVDQLVGESASCACAACRWPRGRPRAARASAAPPARRRRAPSASARPRVPCRPPRAVLRGQIVRAVLDVGVDLLARHEVLDVEGLPRRRAREARGTARPAARRRRRP